MKKLSFLLIFAMLIMTTSAAFAANNINPKPQDNQKTAATMINEGAFFVASPGVKILSRETISKDVEKITIRYTNFDVTSEITKSRLLDGYDYDIIEGEKHNDVVVKDNGEVFIDGNEVVYSAPQSKLTSSESISNNNGGITPMNMVTYHTMSPLIGSSSDYTVADSTKSSNIILDAAISTLTITALSVALAFCPYVPAAIGAGIGLGTLVSDVFSVADAFNVQETKIFYTTTIKKYKNNGPHTYAFKYTTKFTNQAKTITYDTSTEYYTYVI